ncbi:hypothetical protein GA0070621_0488 [Micromonospora narathiwatensis]|uniref:Uncharacterized protein n=1 Tax=Micromonospora narathiwatensis TaxID=299146 RepID=A0A1A8Z4H9_9ACTN|nr:hypothetical protein GA0070621_0488 [Micromonospora narathiwatensis]
MTKAPFGGLAHTPTGGSGHAQAPSGAQTGGEGLRPAGSRGGGSPLRGAGTMYNDRRPTNIPGPGHPDRSGRPSAPRFGGLPRPCSPVQRPPTADHSLRDATPPPPRPAIQRISPRQARRAGQDPHEIPETGLSQHEEAATSPKSAPRERDAATSPRWPSEGATRQFPRNRLISARQSRNFPEIPYLAEERRSEAAVPRRVRGSWPAGRRAGGPAAGGGRGRRAGGGRGPGAEGGPGAGVLPWADPLSVNLARRRARRPAGWDV